MKCRRVSPNASISPILKVRINIFGVERQRERGKANNTHTHTSNTDESGISLRGIMLRVSLHLCNFCLTCVEDVAASGLWRGGKEAIAKAVRVVPGLTGSHVRVVVMLEVVSVPRIRRKHYFKSQRPRTERGSD